MPKIKLQRISCYPLSLLFLLAFVLSLPTFALATTLNVPATYGTIADAITAAANGDLILVDDGVYNENINFNGKDITLRSVNGAAVTTISGNGSNAPVVTLNSGESSAAVLDGFTIDNIAVANGFT